MFHPKNGALDVGFEVNPPNNAQVMKHLNTVSRVGSTFTVFMGTDLYVNLKRWPFLTHENVISMVRCSYTPEI